jgi:BlaI family transcriptional regulator, penicillinase repressor
VDAEKQLSRRERQIMDIVYARGEATASNVLDDLADPPSRASVRTLLRILEGKGHLRHLRRSREFVYQPVRPRRQAGRSALSRVLHTFFGGSLEQAVAAHLADGKTRISNEELRRIEELIRQNRMQGN